MDKKKNKKTNWGMEIFLAVIFAVLILLVANFYCNKKCVGNLMIEELVEECDDRGLQISHYIIYPNDNSISVTCKNPEFQGIDFNITD